MGSVTKKNAFLVYIYIISAILLLVIDATADQKSDAEKFKAASLLIGNGQYLEAVGTYHEIVADSQNAGNRARALLFSGSVYDFYLDQPETSLNQFREIYENYPKSASAPDALYNSGRLLYKMDRFKDAFNIFGDYLNQYPENMRRNSAEIWAGKSKAHIADKSIPEPEKPALLFETLIRVLLKKRARQLVFNSPGKIIVSNYQTGKTIFSGTGPVAVTERDGRIAINTEKTSAAVCRIESEFHNLSEGGKPYRGRFLVYSGRSGLTLVNHVHIEKYLYGVVPKEMSWLWSYEALKAQAIASRTYALYIREKQKSGKFYDLSATTASQVYGGLNAEKEQASKAVDETFGKVMLFDDNLIIAYFHANSGGYTESSKNVWGADIPYLRTVRDTYSSLPQEKKWSHSLSYKKIRRLLSDSRLTVGKIKKIRPEARSASGRIKSFLVYSSKGNIRFRSNNFRMKIGATDLKSTCFNIKSGKFSVAFEGRGYGHGVGMSQWGAHQMALSGHLYGDILKHYYKGVTIADSGYDSNGAQSVAGIQ